MNLCGTYRIEDKHGKTIHYTEKQRDIRTKGSVIALGDAISTINPLGWEGIRHAMMSGRLAAQTIENYLKGKSKNLNSYDHQMKDYFGRKWLFSEKLMGHLFKTQNDALIDRSVSSFQIMNNREIMKVVFGYQFRHTLKSYFWYFITRIISMGKKRDERAS